MSCMDEQVVNILLQNHRQLGCVMAKYEHQTPASAGTLHNYQHERIHRSIGITARMLSVAVHRSPSRQTFTLYDVDHHHACG